MNKRNNFKLWYLVLLSAAIGCIYAAAFPQFSMTVEELSFQSGISTGILLASDSVKSIFIVAGMLMSGFFYRRFGLKLTFVFATLCFLIPQTLLPSVTSLPILFLLKSIQGLSSLMYSVFLTLIMKYALPGERGISSAVFNGIFFGGSGILTMFTSVILSRRGWTDSFHSLSIILIILSVVWLFTIQDEERNSCETEQIYRGGQKSVIGSAQLWLLVAGLFSTVWTNQALLVDMPLYTKALGFSALQTGRIMSITTIGIIAACFFSGKLSDIAAFGRKDKAGARIKVLMIGPGVIILSVAFLILFSNISQIVFSIAVLFLSFGSAWGFGSFYCILPELYNQKSLPVVTGIAGGIADTAMPLSPLVVGVVFGLRGLWLLGWLVCVFTALISLTGAIFLLRSLKSQAPV